MRSFYVISISLLAAICQTSWADESATGNDTPATESEGGLRTWAEGKAITFDRHHGSVWVDEIGNGFHGGLIDAGVNFGAGFGLATLGSTQEHDLAIAKLHVGWMLTDTVGKDRWYRGNWEVLGEFEAGGQFSPKGAYFFGLTPIVRYNFSTGTRFVPFVDGGSGISLTDIKEPDLSTVFQFHSQIGVGTHYFFTENCAMTLQSRFIHISNAGIEHPNLGVNTLMFYAGLSWLF